MKHFLLFFSLMMIASVYAATPVNLMQHPFILNSLAGNQSNINVVEISRAMDFNQTEHIRMQQTYLGYTVWGADFVKHIMLKKAEKKYFMNGKVYQNLHVDLANTSAQVFDKTQAEKALNSVIDNYQHKIGGRLNIEDKQSELMVYVDRNNLAHWAYKISFFIPRLKSGAASRPNLIVDAKTFQVYREWNKIQTSKVIGGGFGGNPKMGMLIYDGLTGHLANLNMMRDYSKNCTLQNKDVIVKNFQTDKLINFKCNAIDSLHNNIYWDDLLSSINGGYSPANDALFGGNVLKNMYKDWCGLNVLAKRNKSPMQLKMYIHENVEGDNAYWDGDKNIMVFGDGKVYFYPLTSIGVTGHEVSHGFTQQHSNLVYDGQSGGMNESFSDMAAQAAEVYAYGVGKNNWQIGWEIFKLPNLALRYMDMPSTDCYGGTPGVGCSIDNADQYTQGLDVHYSSGVYNRFFYLLANSDGWDIKSAFITMVNANAYYWTETTDFNSGACGVLQAAMDLNMDLTAIYSGFAAVKVDYTNGGICILEARV